MFTGIITDIGTVRSIERAGDTRMVIATALATEDLVLGASVACSGVCLTVVAREAGTFSVDVSGETLACTTLGNWQPGQGVNLERALRLGDELGGHIVSGHVDGLARLVDRQPEGDSLRLTFETGGTLGRYIATKGSVAIDGISLTVNTVQDEGDTTRFGINIIPHTQTATTLGTLQVGEDCNLEIDMLARYVARLTQR